jgi:hypothetical protein
MWLPKLESWWRHISSSCESSAIISNCSLPTVTLAHRLRFVGQWISPASTASPISPIVVTVVVVVFVSCTEEWALKRTVPVELMNVVCWGPIWTRAKPRFISEWMRWDCATCELLHMKTLERLTAQLHRQRICVPALSRIIIIAYISRKLPNFDSKVGHGSTTVTTASGRHVNDVIVPEKISNMPHEAWTLTYFWLWLRNMQP